MKIAWFTPFSTKSAIARFSAAVVNEIAQLVEIEVFHFGTGPVYPSAAPVRAFRSASEVRPDTLRAFDVCAYNLGNHLPFHRDIFELSLLHPGINILHDFVMHHFFAGYYLEQKKDPAGYVQLMRHVYGPDAEAVAQESVHVPGRSVWAADRVVDYPLWEPAGERALGLVAHSRFFAERAVRRFAGPVARIPLAYTIDVASAAGSRAELRVPDGAVVLLTVGHVNANKQVETVIRSLGALRGSVPEFVYVVVGPCPSEYRRSLEALASSAGLAAQFRLAGEVSHQHLCSWLSVADLCVNLRYPSTEGASASAIEEMLWSKPVVVNDASFYSELPDDCVIKVPVNRADELERLLRRAMSDEPHRQAVGSRARAFAEAEFHPRRYAAEFVSFAREVMRSQPVLQLCDLVGSTLSGMGVTQRSEIPARAAGEVLDLFCRPVSERV